MRPIMVHDVYILIKRVYKLDRTQSRLLKSAIGIN